MASETPKRGARAKGEPATAPSEPTVKLDPAELGRRMAQALDQLPHTNTGAVRTKTTPLQRKLAKDGFEK